MLLVPVAASDPESVPTVDVVLPALNEEATIASTIRGFAAELPFAHFIIADNGSADRTAEEASRAAQACGVRFTVLSVPERGKGNAIREAFRVSSADIVVMVDADSTYPANRVHDLMAPITSSAADMVVGDRISDGSYSQQNGRRFHEAGNRLVQSTINRVFGGSLNDILSGYRAFSQRFIETYPVMVSGFELETDLSIHALDKRIRVAEISVEYRERPSGSNSKLNTFTDGARVLITLFNLFRRFRPFAFFSLVSGILLVLAALAGVLPVLDWVSARYVEHVPLAVLAAALGLAALISFAVALVLDALAHQSRREFELRFLQAARDVRRKGSP